MVTLRNNYFSIESMPFDFGSYNTRAESIPVDLPFSLGINENFGLIHQSLNDNLREALNHYYTLGGYGSTPLGEGEYGKAQGEYMLKAVLYILALKERKVSDLSFLEIGASYGFLLHSLGEIGAREILGIEPGEEGISGSTKYSIPMIRDFFPTQKLNGRKFDIILSHCMLEHVEDAPTMFLEMFNVTEENGLILFAVPDCEPKMSIGDLSIISHQHINYFTKESIENLLKEVGYVDIGVMTSSRRAILFAWGRRPKQIAKEINRSKETSLSSALFSQFTKSCLANISAIQKLVDKFEAEGKSIGLYAPAPNVAALIKYRTPPRTFNIDIIKQGKKIVDCAGPFESPDALIENPVDVLFIAPVDYDSEIQADLKARGIPTSTLIISLKELYEKESGIKYPIDSLSKNNEFIL